MMKEVIRQGMRPVFLLFEDVHARRVWFEYALTLFVMISCATLAAFKPAYASQTSTTGSQTTSVVQPVTQPATEEATPVSAPEASTATVVAVQPPVQAKSCVPNYSYQSAPGLLALANRSPGLHVSQEGPFYYGVYGATRAEVEAQLHACGPRDDFAGDASYSVSWSYAISRPEGSELCQLSSVKVGLRTQVLLPTRDDTLPLARQWSSFSAGLAVHESGHVNLSQQYAARLFALLQNYPPGDCYTMAPVVERAAQSTVAELGTAQVRYDAATAHGATQGARW